MNILTLNIFQKKRKLLGSCTSFSAKAVECSLVKLRDFLREGFLNDRNSIFNKVNIPVKFLPQGIFYLFLAQFWVFVVSEFLQ